MKKKIIKEGLKRAIPSARVLVEDMLKRKKKFKARFLKKVFARLHMSLIMICTVMSGLILSKVMLIMGIKNMLIRFPIVLIGAYISFFIIMKLWLWYLTSSYRKKRIEVLDSADLLQPGFETGSTNISTPFEGGGGQFGGAGASGSFEYGETINLVSESLDGTTIVTDSASDAVADTAGEAVSGIAEEGGIVLIALAVILIVILGGGIFLIYQAPLILSEAAFEVVLASSLIKSSKKMDSPDWIGSVFRTTWKPFFFTLSVSLVGAAIIVSYCPQATKLTEVIKKCI
jgi:hypothetical protein